MREHGPARINGPAKAGRHKSDAEHHNGGAKLSKSDVLGAFRRTALLEAATRVFGECGFERATMARIAREADVAKGTVYLYYASKQEIYDAALNGGFAALDERARAGIEQAVTLREGISAFITARAAYFFERRDFFRMYVAAIARQVTDEKARPSDFTSMVDRQTRRLEATVTRAIARGEIRRVDPAATALAVFDLTRGLVARRLIGRAGPDVSADVEFLTALIWRGLERPSRVESRRDAVTRQKAKRQR